MPDNGIGPRVQKIVFGISVRSLFLQITQQLFVPDNDFANKKMVPYTIVIGSDEMKSGALAFKDMKKGEQRKLSIEEIISILS